MAKREVRSCGFLIFRKDKNSGKLEFLILKHSRRLDIPKGHVDKGETDLECAYRELQEETGFSRRHLRRVSKFRFELKYDVTDKRDRSKKARKTLVVFLARLRNQQYNRTLVLTEHRGFEWMKWNPPHKLQRKTIDPLLAYAEEYLKKNPDAL